MANVLKSIPDSVAASMLRHERAKLGAERAQLVREIAERQRRIDRIDARLQEVSDGERVLSEHGY